MNKRSQGDSLVLGTGVGVAIGCSLGVAMDNLPLGLALGVGIGTALGAAGVFRSKSGCCRSKDHASSVDAPE